MYFVYCKLARTPYYMCNYYCIIILGRGVLSRYLAYLLFRIFVGVLVLIYRRAIIHVYVSIRGFN